MRLYFIYAVRAICFALIILTYSCASNSTKQSQQALDAKQQINKAEWDKEKDTTIADTADASNDAVVITKPKKKKELSLIDKLRSKFLWNHLYLGNKRVQYELNTMRNNQAYVDKTFSGAEVFLSYVNKKINENKMPAELVFLPGVESQFNPLAYSFAHASGMWQIIPSTAEILGLEINWWQDERRDIPASTDAAIDYLTSMSKRFNGDWLLALAAYNAGPLRIERAIKKNKKRGKPTDYWSLSIPRETKRYVPRLIALVELVNNPEKYGVKIPNIKDQENFTSIKIKDRQLDLKHLSENIGISHDELISFNSGFNQRFTKPFGEYSLHIPIHLKDEAHDYIHAEKPVLKEYWISYKPLKNESLGKIAKKFHTSPKRLSDVNRLSNSKISYKQYLLVPVNSESIARYASYYHDNPDKIRVRTRKSEKYKLRRGDSLWKLSKKFKVPISDLMRWNKINKRTRLYAGKKIYIKKTGYTHDEPIKLNPKLEHKLLSKVYYPVRSGDTLSHISNKFGVRTNDILKWNPKIKSNRLKKRTTLVLYVDVTKTY